MAFGIDDVLTAAAAGISLTDTIVKTVRLYRRQGRHLDIERLIEEVRITALQRIDEAEGALAQFERTLQEKGVDLNRTLQEVINSTSIWQPFEQYRLKRYRTSFNALADAAYNAGDDIAALVRCRDQTREMGIAVVESAAAKQALHSQLLNAESTREAIALLRNELLRQKSLLMP
ncbi:MAG: hypothetical protein AB7P24_09225 [Nitrospira sp.]